MHRVDHSTPLEATLDWWRDFLSIVLLVAVTAVAVGAAIASNLRLGLYVFGISGASTLRAILIVAAAFGTNSSLIVVYWRLLRRDPRSPP